MTTYSLLKHKELDKSLQRRGDNVQHKVTWSLVELALRGRTPQVKGVVNHNTRWRRTPVKGNQYYMWWIPISETDLSSQTESDNEHPILIREIRHHDRTSEPLGIGDINDYATIDVPSLDPRHQDQFLVEEMMGHDSVGISIVKGLPGSGKTVALLYALIDLAILLDEAHVLYITYTPNLRDESKRFVESYGIADKVHVYTLDELEQEILKHPEPVSDSYLQFEVFAKHLGASKTGSWTNHLPALFAELRAYLIGMALPFTWLRSRRQISSCSDMPLLSYTVYSQLRNVNKRAAKELYHIAQLALDREIFNEQVRTWTALDALMNGSHKGLSWLDNVGGIIVDEIQDLTLLQIALLAEIGRKRVQANPHNPLAFIVAGDESQIIQPSGFDWRVTKDLLSSRLQNYPSEFELRYQKRSPRVLADLINKSSELYNLLPKHSRPKALKQSRIPLDAEPGYLFTCRINPGKMLWTDLMAELVDKPGRVLIDLSEDLRAYIPPEDLLHATEVIHSPREIKGIDRRTVLIWGLDKTIQKVIELAELTGSHSDTARLLQARHLLDKVRVALSRSTDTLVIFEQEGVSLPAEWPLEEVSGQFPITLNALLERLQSEEMTVIERIEGYLQEADERCQQEEYERAYERNRRAVHVVKYLKDETLQRLVSEQRHNISQVLIEHAYEFLSQVKALYEQEHYGDAYQIANETQQYLAKIDDADLTGEAKNLPDQLYRLIAQICWRKANQALENNEHAQIVHWFKETSITYEKQEKSEPAIVLDYFAKRYQSIPQGQKLPPKQIKRLLKYITDCLDAIKSNHEDIDFHDIISQWHEEAYQNLKACPETKLHLTWAMIGHKLRSMGFLPNFKEQVDHLLAEVETITDKNAIAFKAWGADYHNNHEESLTLWEQIGDYRQAAEAARKLGNVQQAVKLFKKADEHLPDSLATLCELRKILKDVRAKQNHFTEGEKMVIRNLFYQLDRLLQGKKD
ncbi:MAG: hypothetical protein B6242_01900 [Anaerolineaceae bacterium 4572_78]|nr:MAG: hypothetical protein B6242_01900 [Anaerolineaceae bacterium 4572_78]